MDSKNYSSVSKTHHPPAYSPYLTYLESIMVESSDASAPPDIAASTPPQDMPQAPPPIHSSTQTPCTAQTTTLTTWTYLALFLRGFSRLSWPLVVLGVLLLWTPIAFLTISIVLHKSIQLDQVIYLQAFFTFPIVFQASMIRTPKRIWPVLVLVFTGFIFSFLIPWKYEFCTMSISLVASI